MTLSRSFTPARPLVLVGAGKMGIALLGGWLERGVDPDSVVVIDPAPPADSMKILRRARIRPHKNVPDCAARFIVVAVKPQIMAAVLPGLKPMLRRGTVVLSIAAGTTLANLTAGLGQVALIRSMPNTPAQLGRGITAAIANDGVNKAGRALADRLLSAVGEVVWVDREALIDVVTAVSGSGPAYVFLLAETLAEAGVAAGLDEATSERLARATVAGAGELLHQSNLAAGRLREDVTSPNGTTAAALKILMARDGMAGMMKKAVAAATKRSRELSG